MQLSKIQPQPWRWCMQVPSHEMQVAEPEPLVHGQPTESHPNDPLSTTLLLPALTLQKRDKTKG